MIVVNQFQKQGSGNKYPPPYLLPLLLLHCYYRNNTTLQVKLQLTDLMAEEVKLSVKVSAAKEELAAAEAKLAAAKVENYSGRSKSRRVVL